LASNRIGKVKTSKPELDLAIVKLSNKEVTNCRQLPSPKQLEEALLDSYGNVWTLTERGIRNIISVRMRSIDGNKLHLKTADPGDNFSKGMSGAPLIMGGVIVGILQKTKVNSRKAIALKIDSVRLHLSDYFDSYNFAPPKTNTDWQPFDIRQLPDDLQILVQQARQTKELAEATKQRALDTEKEVDRAVARAKSLEPNRYNKGYAYFTSENGKEKYAGQATFSDKIIKMGKWVEKEWIAGNNAGDRHKCFIINNLCQNIGVIYYGINSRNFNDLFSWHGEFRNGQREGLGHLKWKDGTEAFLRKRPNWELAPGVWIKSDKRRFEGMIGADWEKGVCWNEEGKVINIGIWKDGSLFINRNDELL
jgi:hypothetical protein